MANRIHCCACGRFMALKDLEEGHLDFESDTHFSSERIDWYHKSCWEFPNMTNPAICEALGEE